MLNYEKIKKIQREAKEGDLVLAIATHRNPNNVPTLGIVESVNDTKIYFSSAFRLDIVEPGIDKTVVSQSNKSLDFRYNPDFYLGIDNIIKYLESKKHVKHHLSWVKKLKEPYTLPTCRSLWIIP